MRALIRFLTRTAGGSIETRERMFEGEALTLGRATDQVLHLKDARVALEHARITRSAGRTLLVCKSPAQVIVNGAICRDAELRSGDVIQVGANTLRVLEPAPGFDFTFSFELDSSADARAAAIEPPKLALRELGWRKRRWAWVGFVGVLALGLVIPWSAAFRDGGSAALRAAHVPSDRVWLSGALHLAHHNLNDDCGACHVRPFERVASAACLTCHAANLTQHVPAGHPQGTALLAAQCTACHVEHDEPARLVQTDQRLCASCHGQLEAVAGASTQVVRTTDFLIDHPEFRISLLEPSESSSNEDVWRTIRLRLDAATRPRENSQLKFPHDKHLVREGVDSPRGKQRLDCGSCHGLEEGGARFKPIRMEQHCASCHTLSFDPAEPDRAVPHGDPKEVLRTLTDHYSARYLAGYPDTFAVSQPNRPIGLPAVDVAPAERARLLGLARSRAQQVARDLFERRVCVDCHQVERTGPEAAQEWRVKPVRLTTEWMPHARFSHASHGTSVTPCKTCHTAASSAHATDVLMPKIADCRACHGGEVGRASASALIPSTCTSCHGFHGDGNALWLTSTVSSRILPKRGAP